jgi:hypothetical protein
VIEVISKAEASMFVRRWHYSDVIHNTHGLLCLAFRDAQGLAGVAMWGVGTRPLHTIRLMFPSLGVEDYWELNRLCLRDELPRNSESWFLAKCADWFRQNQPKKKLLYSWADGMRGKPGYVYQASSWLYGGFITTSLYLTPDGEPVHPRMLQKRYGGRGKDVYERLGLWKYFGRQFRYLKFICSHQERKRLLKESPLDWSRCYPKHDDLTWTVLKAGEASRETRDAPSIKRSGQFRQPAPTLFDGGNDE